MYSTTAAFRVDGKVCLITGGASGLGLAGARALLDAGAAGVTLVDMNPETLSFASASLQSDKVSIFTGDVSKEEVNKGMIEHAVNKWGKAPEVVVLCAGISQAYQVPLAEMPEEVWDKVMAVNLKGSFLGLKHAAAAMLANPEGGKGCSIILISSQLGLDGVPDAGAYSASKFAVRGLMSSAAQELGPKGIRVNAIAPGPIDTPMLRDWPAEKRDDLCGQCTLGRFGKAEEIGQTILYLASPAGAYANGSTIKQVQTRTSGAYYHSVAILQPPIQMAHTEKQQSFWEREHGAVGGATSAAAPMHRLDADGFPLPPGDIMTTPPSARRRRISRPADLEMTPSSGSSYAIPVSSPSTATSTPRTTRSSIGRGLPSDVKGLGTQSGVEQGQEERDVRREHRRVVTDSVQLMRDTTEHHHHFLCRADAATSGPRAVSYGYQQRDQHRPLPAPPSASAALNDMHPSTNTGIQPSSSSRSLLHPRTPARTHGTTTTGHNTSADARGVVVSTSSSSLFSPATPGQPDPRRLDRAGLIGVGELATTPRYTTHSSTNWNGGNGGQRSALKEPGQGVKTSRSEAMSNDPNSEQPGVPPSRSLDVVTPGSRRDRQVSGPRVRTGGTSTQQRAGGEESRMRSQRAAGVPRLPSFGDLGGSFKVPTPTSAVTPSASSSRSSSPPFAVRPQQHRQPTSSTTPSSATPTTPSAHSILRQFGSTRDFSHLPPSPSSASIGKIMMKESASMGNLPMMAGSGGGEGGAYSANRIKEWRTPSFAGSPRKGSKGVSAVGAGAEGDLQLDEETREVIRRLDGLGKSSSGSFKRVQGHGMDSAHDHEKSGSGSIGLGIKSYTSERASMFSASSSTLAANTTDSRGTKRAYATELPAVTIPTFKSHGNTITSSSSSPSVTVPPVPPLPKLFQPTSQHVEDHINRGKGVVRSTTMNDFGKTAAYYEPIRDTLDTAISPSYLTVPTAHEGRLSNSASSPTLMIDAESEMMTSNKSPVLSVTSADSFDIPAPASTTATSRPRMMNKKWSFSSALNLVSSGSKQKLASSDLPSPGLPSSSVTSSSTLDAAMSPPSVFASPLSSTMDVESLAPPPLSHRSSSTSESGSTARLPPVSAGKAVLDQDGYMVPPSVNTTRRGTGPSLPFFRRSSSSSFQAPPLTKRQSTSSKVGQDQPLRHEKSATSISGPGSQQRKTVLGIGLPSFGSKRNSVSQEAVIAEQQEMPYSQDGTGLRVRHERKGSFGWGGRKRGKTMSSPIEPQAATLSSYPKSNTLTKKPSFTNERSKDDSKYNSYSLNSQRSALGHMASHSNLPTSQSVMLPSVLGSPSHASPARQTYQSANNPITSATPTRIPRITTKLQSTPAARSNATTPVTKKAVNSRNNPPSTNATQRKSSNGILSEYSISGDKSRTSAIQDLPRTEDSDQVEGKLKLSGSRHVSSSSFSSTKRVLPEPPVHSGDSAGSERGNSSSRRNTSFAVASDGSDTSRLAIRMPSSGPSRISQNSGYSSMSNVSRPGSSRAALSRSGSPANNVVDEDEMLGDEEMAAFFKRQRARQAKGEKMGVELEALLNFPAPGMPVEAMSPHAFIKTHFDTLSLYERREILDYSAIWFSGSKSSKKAASPDSTQNNYGYDDERGDYLINFGDHLAYRYEILGLLGKGSFGQVIQCRDYKTGDCVAVKIIRNKKRFHQQALVEVRILENLVQWDPEDKHNLIKIVEKFSFRSHLCIVTELLSFNLYELVKANNFVGFSTGLIRRFTVQMLSALQVMRNNRIIHCDLKPENILLRHPAKSGIKVIDFGSSCHEDERVYTYIQSRFYRSPEIILGMKYNTAIDMWSLGCILAEMHTGFPIFPGENEQEQLACIMELLGIPERHLLEKGERKRSFFDSHGQPRPVTNSKGKRRRPGSKTLAAVLKCDDLLFVDFITKCLIWDPERRLKPSGAMHHPWILASKKIRVTSHSPVSSIPSTPRVLGPSRQYSVIEDTIIKNKSPGSTTTSGLSGSRSSLFPVSGEASVKSSANRNLHQDMMKARISKPTPLMAKERSGSSSLATLTYENDALLTKAPKIRQLTGKSYKMPA
ncbi:hypothetical protein QFC21_005649 [Naganishia friedmannii]|uniref:Uncharacterized protein n=1 Tax=Naganishia friedmannii TaxID=89922 RepID=A0ACC2V8A4_9TREE|nr:hypothetical protein QFC21_005649 [Naganishia friedmannii]